MNLWAQITPGELYSVACAALWAVAVVLYRAGGRHVPPVALNLFKDLVGLVLFLITLPLLGISLAPADASFSDWAVLLLSGALGIGVADTLFFASLNRLGAGGSALVDALYSPFLMVCAFFYLDEPVGPALLLAMALMISALFLGTEPGGSGQAGPSIEARRQTRLGIVLGAAAMGLMAGAIVLAKPVLSHSDPWWATTVRLIGGVALLAGQGLLPGNRAAVLASFRPSRAWWVTVPGALIGAYLAMILWLMGMKLTQTTVAGILNQLSTVFVIVLATLFLREPLRPRKVVAVALGIAGGLVVML